MDKDFEGIGHIDCVGKNIIQGWACDLRDKDISIPLELVTSDGRRIETLADIFRPDVRDAGYGNGYHGFAIDFSSLRLTNETIDIRFCHNKASLLEHPIPLDPHLRLLASELPRFSALIRSLLVKIHAKGLRVASPNQYPVSAALASPEKATFVSRGQIRKLFETADPAIDREGLISRYLRFELLRAIGTKQLTPARQDGFFERLKILKWYLSSFNAHRQSYKPVQVPLSKEQLAFLNSPMPLSAGDRGITVALYNFLFDERTSRVDVSDEQTYKEAIFWWCLKQTPTLNLSDRLVTPEQEEVLRAEVNAIGEPFPITVFMKEYYKQDEELHFLDLEDPRDRCAYLYYLILNSAIQPNLFRYLPRRASKRVLKQVGSEGWNVFERLAEKCGSAGGGYTGVSAQALRIYCEAEIDKTLSVERRLPSTLLDSGECFTETLRLDGPIEDGVAVIGPIHQVSGLGRAARLSLHALSRTEKLPPSVIDFDMDHPSPVEASLVGKYPPYENRRLINLIHLNADSVPRTFAYLQSEIFETSYNIGFFFWELDKLPQCHKLALEMLDEVWVASTYNQTLYEAEASIPVIKMGLPIEAAQPVTPIDRSALDIDPEAFVFLTTFDSFSSIGRKNPLAVVDAFRLAFPLGSEPVNLVVKTQNRTEVKDTFQNLIWAKIDRNRLSDPRIIVINETYSFAELLSLKMTCDCYVSLHRSEGWGLGIIEAMQLGKPVICTAYSGNMEFCNETTAELVGFDLIPALEQEYSYVERGSLWADPHIDVAAAKMRELASDRAKACLKGLNASHFVEQNYSIDAVATRYSMRLMQIRSSMQSSPKR